MIKNVHSCYNYYKVNFYEKKLFAFSENHQCKSVGK